MENLNVLAARIERAETMVMRSKLENRLLAQQLWEEKLRRLRAEMREREGASK